MDINEKLDEIQKEIQEGHAALQHRHDRSDQEIGYLHYKIDRMRSFLYTLWKAVVDIFKKEQEK
jgi:hypothetical protein